MRAYKRVLAIDADHAEACNNLARVLQAQGKTKDASAYYARSLALMPQLLEQYAGICATLFSLLPELAEALRRQAAAWPQRLSLNDLFDDNLDAVAADPLFLYLLQSTPARDVGFERLLTAMRHSLLKAAIAGLPVASHQLSFTCALAKQCFINEYVFAVTPQEDDQLSLLRRRDRQRACSGRSNRTDAACRVGDVLATACRSVRGGAARTRMGA